MYLKMYIDADCRLRLLPNGNKSLELTDIFQQNFEIFSIEKRTVSPKRLRSLYWIKKRLSSFINIVPDRYTVRACRYAILKL